MRVDHQIVFSVHRIMVRCNGATTNVRGDEVPCMKQMTVYISGGSAGGLDEALAQVGWWSDSNNGDKHFCLEHG